MIFTSTDFVIFLVLVFFSYWFVAKSILQRNIVILVASYIFYGYWDPRFLFLITISTSVDFYCAQAMQSSKTLKRAGFLSSTFVIGSSILFVLLPDYLSSGSIDFGLNVVLGTIFIVVLAYFLMPKLMSVEESKRRKLFLTISIVSNLSILAFFKYFNFFAENLTVLTETMFGFTPSSFTLNIILPVGISFYTFQTISYSIDVYRKDVKPSKNIIEFASFVSFFPQLVAGPIERGKHLLPQFQTFHSFPKLAQFREGLWLIGWGFFKKLVIADNAGIIANNIFAPFDEGNFSAGTTDGLTLLVGVYAFAIQIYCDFSAYSDIARGTAKLFGFDLRLNFRLPYFAADPSSFWKRWHISLSSWLRDYLYIPLGGNRGNSFFVYRNLFLTMLLGGLWHGAAWNFILWGAYHGLLLSVYKALGINTEREGYPFLKRIWMTFIFFHLTCIGWLLFRAQNIETIEFFLVNIITNPVATHETWNYFTELLFYSWFLIVIQFIQAYKKDLLFVLSLHWFAQLNIWYFMIFSMLVLAATTSTEFIYFAF